MGTATGRFIVARARLVATQTCLERSTGEEARDVDGQRELAGRLPAVELGEGRGPRRTAGIIRDRGPGRDRWLLRPASRVNRFEEGSVSAKSSRRSPMTEVARLVAELEKAEAYEQRLRQVIVDVKDQLAAGNTARALSMLNEALNYIDNATDVVAPSAER